jgi:hypothetical protein
MSEYAPLNPEEKQAIDEALRQKVKKMDERYEIVETPIEDAKPQYFVRRSNGQVELWTLLGEGPSHGKMYSPTESGEPQFKYSLMSELIAQQAQLQSEYAAAHQKDDVISAETAFQPDEDSEAYPLQVPAQAAMNIIQQTPSVFEGSSVKPEIAAPESLESWREEVAEDLSEVATANVVDEPDDTPESNNAAPQDKEEQKRAIEHQFDLRERYAHDELRDVVPRRVGALEELQGELRLVPNTLRISEEMSVSLRRSWANYQDELRQLGGRISDYNPHMVFARALDSALDTVHQIRGVVSRAGEGSLQDASRVIAAIEQVSLEATHELDANEANYKSAISSLESNNESGQEGKNSSALRGTINGLEQPLADIKANLSQYDTLYGDIRSDAFILAQELEDLRQQVARQQAVGQGAFDAIYQRVNRLSSEERVVSLQRQDASFANNLEELQAVSRKLSAE